MVNYESDESKVHYLRASLCCVELLFAHLLSRFGEDPFKNGSWPPAESRVGGRRQRVCVAQLGCPSDTIGVGEQRGGAKIFILVLIPKY